MLVKDPFREEFREVKGEPLSLRLIGTFPEKDGALPFYWWSIILNAREKEIGKISLRLGHNDHSYFNGNVGFEIDEPYRGRHYALLASQMVVSVARAHGMDRLYFTCDFDNPASYKTIERLGARLVGEAAPPRDYIFYFDGIKKHRIYVLEL